LNVPVKNSSWFSGRSSADGSDWFEGCTTILGIVPENVEKNKGRLLCRIDTEKPLI
jgi:hypothetical protein